MAQTNEDVVSVFVCSFKFFLSIILVTNNSRRNFQTAYFIVTVAPDMAAANFVHQYFHEGYVVFTEGNNTGKICVDSLNSSSLLSLARQQSFLEVFGESACKSMSYR